MTLEKQTWKRDTLEKSTEIETLEASAKLSKARRSELSSRAERHLEERKEMEAEVAALGLQVR